MAQAGFICVKCLSRDCEHINRPPLLSPRHIGMLDAAKNGATNKEIGMLLGITTGTVKCYMSQIFDYIQVTNRTEMVLWWLKNQEKVKLLIAAWK